KLYGKTGSGVLLSPDRTRKLKIQHGWFIGWIEKDGRVISFSNHISDDKKQNTFAGQRAKANAKERLIKIINDSNR
ncbi:MAG: class D beta-lactamase, partial [Rickettsiaceae bacterium]|nr:class D beta-lactamase [Rickettsiaceae bacterium]